MDVGHCKDCKWWNDTNSLTAAFKKKGIIPQSVDEHSHEWGDCYRVREDGALIADDEYGSVTTHADFGCIQFEKKETEHVAE